MKKHITIFLGGKCNASCGYCHASKNQDQITNCSPDFLLWLKSESEKHTLDIKFLGGEPTIYLDHMSKVIEACGDKPNYCLMTNGLLLNNKEVINFINNNKILTIISFDGARGSRGYDDVFFRDEYLESLHSIERLGAAATLSKFNFDLDAICKCYAEIETRLQRYMPLFVHATHITTPDLVEYELTDKQYDQYLDFKKKVIDKIIYDFDHGVVNLKLKHFVDYYSGDSADYSFDETRCYNRHHVITDIEGGNYFCGYVRNEETKLGYFGNEESFACQSKLINKKFPKCGECEFRNRCGIACVASINMEKECSHFKQFAQWLRDPIAARNVKLKLIKNLIDANAELKKTGNFFNMR